MNPFARPFACLVCRDSRMLARYASSRKDDLIPCHKCGSLNTEEYDRFRRDAWARDNAAPSICELDLTPEEMSHFKVMRSAHPHAAKATVLSWIEGQRYDPSKDPEFLAVARPAFKEWKHR